MILSKPLVLIRHADFDMQSGNILDHCKNDLSKILVPRLIPVVADKSICMISSPSPRAEQTAEIIARGLGADFSVHGRLEAHRTSDQDLAWIQRYVNNAPCDIVIAVGHENYIETLIDEVLKELRIMLDRRSIKKGEAILLDPAADQVVSELTVSHEMK